MTSTLKQRFHIIRCKDAVRRVIGQCIICTRWKAKQQQQLMGQLPVSRVSYQRPFLETGIDYAGPIIIKASRLRGAKTLKGYIALFVCMATKAVHLELVSDMTTDAFLAALKRFQARRGICAHIHTDNGSNFVGAAKELRKVLEAATHDEAVLNHAMKNNTIWHFIPPRAPHFGGIWEAAVKSTKYHLRRVLGETILTFEYFNTLLIQIDGILNSRPLCQLSKDELDPLTPSHFLIGHPITLLPEGKMTEIKTNNLSRWQHIQQMMQHFWKRWQNEYLLNLQQRQKWMYPKTNCKVDDLVVVMDKDAAPSRWLMGRIKEVITGSDGLVRVVNVKTKLGIMKRSITKICILPSGSYEPREAGC